jgi:hypothetical protein
MLQDGPMRAGTILLLCSTLAACEGDDSGSSPDESTDAGTGRDAVAEAPAPADGGRADASPTDASSPVDAARADAATSALLAFRAALDAHYRDCKVISAGDLFDVTERARFLSDEQGGCTARCDLEADCATLHALHCEGGAGSPLLACYDGCLARENPSGYSCTPTGPVVRQNQRCDERSNDCPHNEDELGCGTYRCANGQILGAAHSRCNYRIECDDGSDELDCATHCPP